MPTFAIPNEKNGTPAEVAQLVEHNLAKVGVASSSLVFCSKKNKSAAMLTFVLKKSQPDWQQSKRLTKISPDGVQLYVSRPCAQGRLFSLYTLQEGIIYLRR